MTQGRFEAEGFSTEIMTALKALTKWDGEDYMDFVRRAAQNPIARVVKRADLEDNMKLDWIANATVRDHERIEKYRRVLPLVA